MSIVLVSSSPGAFRLDYYILCWLKACYWIIKSKDTKRVPESYRPIMMLQIYIQNPIAQKRKEIEYVLYIICIALDHSEISRKAFTHLLTNFLEKGDDITLVNAYQGYQPSKNIFKSENLSPEKLAEIQEKFENKEKENGEQLLNTLNKTLVEQGFKEARVLVVRAKESPKESICKLTEDESFTVICVASRGLGAIKRAFLGSTSDYLVHHAACPVFVVKELEG